MLDRLRKFRLAWLVLLLAMVGFLGYHTANGFPIETNILKLLPDTHTDEVTEQAYRQFEQATGRKTVFMVGSEEVEKAKQGAEVLYRRMIESELFSEISYRVDGDRTRKTYETYSPYRALLLSEEQREYLKSAQPELVTSQAVKTLMSPVSMGASAGIERDPLFTFMEFLKGLQSQAGAFTIEEDLLMADHGDKRYVVLIAQLKDNAFSVSAQDRFDAFYKSAKIEIQSLESGVELVSAGVIHHAVAGTGSARADISTIGVGSWIGANLLVLVAFGSIYPIVTGSLVALTGFIGGIAACIMVFGEIHLFTLVFGSGLVGIAIDYAFHYVCEQVGAGEEWDPDRGLESIFSGATLSIACNVLAYLTLAFTPFTGLQQVAVFNSVGLIAAYFTVVLWFPVLHRKRVNRRSPVTLKWSYWFLGLWGEKRSRALYPIFILVSLGLLTYVGLNVQADDNIRALRKTTPQVLQDEELIKEIAGNSSGTQFFVVRGESQDSVLTVEEALTARLDEEVEKGSLRRYHAISKVLPSPTRQRENFRLLRDLALNPDSEVSSYFENMEFEDSVVAGYRAVFQSPEPSPLTAEELLKSPLSELYEPMWISHPEESVFASIIVLDDVKDLSAMRKLAEQSERVRFVSRADDVSELLKEYRILGTWLVLAGICVVFAFLLHRYRERHGFSVLVAPLGACLSAIAVNVAFGIPLNLFNTLALLIVLGLGIDYTIFFAEKESEREITMHAVFLSGVSTILSFGLLALSGTPVVRAFGLTVFVGIAVSLILAPIVGLDNGASEQS